MSHLPPQHVVDSALDSQSRPVPYPRPAEGAPNVLMIVLDDVGFAQLGCFGSGISTPRIDEVAGGGLRYQRFHVTAVCSSTRAALLTGRNHHAVGMGVTEEAALGFPGYTGRIPRSAATMARLLKDTGYNTMAVGKWHLVPRTETSAAGPFDRWPLGVGFEVARSRTPCARPPVSRSSRSTPVATRPWSTSASPDLPGRRITTPVRPTRDAEPARPSGKDAPARGERREGQPPATAGMTETLVPAGVGVASSSRKRTSSSPT